MKRILIVLMGMFPLLSKAQIVPPGLGDVPMASWFAFGIQQKLDSLQSGGWKSSTYLGVGRKSNSDDYRLLEKPSIVILNQEFIHSFHSNWEYIAALSYRTQFNNPAEVMETNMPFRQEVRLYGRLYYVFKLSRVHITPTFRPEFRKFFTPSFKNYPDNFQIRTRFRLKIDVALTTNRKHRLIVFSEQLFSTSQNNATREFSEFRYGDSRFSLYYSVALKKQPFTINVGYMNNLIGAKNSFSAHHLALDLIWKNPFTRQKSK